MLNLLLIPLLVKTVFFHELVILEFAQSNYVLQLRSFVLELLELFLHLIPLSLHRFEDWLKLINLNLAIDLYVVYLVVVLNLETLTLFLHLVPPLFEQLDLDLLSPLEATCFTIELLSLPLQDLFLLICLFAEASQQLGYVLSFPFNC